MEKNGLTKIAKLQKFRKKKDGSRVDLIFYSINRDEFNELKKRIKKSKNKKLVYYEL